MQLKETGSGEVTVWLAEMAVTIGGTGEAGVIQRKEKESINHHTCNRYQPSLLLCPKTPL